MIPASDKLWGECLGALRQICGDRAVLPTAHVLTSGLIKQGKASLATNDTDDFQEAQYKRRAVRIRVLRMSSIADQDSMKKVISRHNTICANLC